MLLVGLDNSRQIETANKCLLNAIFTGESLGMQSVSFRGGKQECDIYYFKKYDFWVGYRELVCDKIPRYYYSFGIGSFRSVADKKIIVEINIPKAKATAQVAGAFALDERGNTHLVHSGRIGGGKSGVGLQLFWRSYKGGKIDIIYPNTRQCEVAHIGRVDTNDVIKRIFDFVHNVACIKNSINEIKSGKDTDKYQYNFDTSDAYTPEHRGLRKPYLLTDAIEANSYHGYVVEALKIVLQEYNPVNDKRRDLYINDSNKNVKYLFEIKTSIDLQSIYSAIGQLFLNSTNSTVGKYLVVLENLSSDIVMRINTIGIIVVPFKWKGHSVVFTEKEKLLKQLSQSNSPEK